MPGITPPADGAADTGAGAPHSTMTHARTTLSTSRWPDRETGIHALYRWADPGDRKVMVGARLALPGRQRISRMPSRITTWAATSEACAVPAPLPHPGGHQVKLISSPDFT